MVPTVSMFEATIGIPFQLALLFRKWYSRCSTMLARLGASDRLGRISTSSKSSLGSLSIRMVGGLRNRQDRVSTVNSISDLQTVRGVHLFPHCVLYSIFVCFDRLV